MAIFECSATPGMRRVRRLPAIGIAGMLLVPTVAIANVGIGYFMVVLPIMVVSLLAVIPIEGLFYRSILAIDTRRAMVLSLRANVRSTLWGLALGIAFDLTLAGLTGSSGPEPTLGLAAFFLVLFFFFSWRIEYGTLHRRANELPKQKRILATAVANLASYLGMFAVAATVFPAQSLIPERMVAGDGVLSAAPAKLVVVETWRETGRMPVPGASGYTPTTTEQFSITLETEGRIRIHFQNPELRLLDGATIWLIPQIGEDGIEWRCEAPPEIHEVVLPSCRR